MNRMLGIDLGDRRIGLALADSDARVARALVTVRRSTHERDAALIERICAEHGAASLVVGLPLHLDGSEGTQAAATRAWATAVAALTGLPVTFRDERLTSIRAEASVGRMARARDGGPPTRHTRQRHRAAVDREAARRILQSELDARATTTPSTIGPQR